jgi:hypothetical protein
VHKNTRENEVEFQICESEPIRCALFTTDYLVLAGNSINIYTIKNN